MSQQSQDNWKRYRLLIACTAYMVINALCINQYLKCDRFQTIDLFRQIAVSGYCFFLCTAHLLQWIYCAEFYKKMSNASETCVQEKSNEKWTLSLVLITLPLGLSLVSDIFGVDGILQLFGEEPHALSVAFSKVAFYFAKSVFFVMLTLEIVNLIDVHNIYWRDLITASIILNLIGFSFFLVIGEPKNEGLYHPLTAISIALSGVFSLFTSYKTISYSRAIRRQESVNGAGSGNSGTQNSGGLY